jgi:hypothetical protein
MRPAKNIASAPRNITVASQALLAIGRLGFTGGAGGSPPPNSSRVVGAIGASSSRRAVEVRAIMVPKKNYEMVPLINQLSPMSFPQ